MALQAYGMSEENAVRLLLPGHVCKEHHSLAQAMLPRAILGALDPATQRSRMQAMGDEVKENYSAFLLSMQNALIDVGRRLADPVAS